MGLLTTEPEDKIRVGFRRTEIRRMFLSSIPSTVQYTHPVFLFTEALFSSIYTETQKKFYKGI